jgi:NAD(P)-dependent dehydrogenase (short-subunit alcohol dehydrogenase family)
VLIEDERMRLSDKVAFITGAGKGIGQAIALRFAAEGAAVMLLDVDEQALTQTANTIAAHDGQCLSVCGTVASSHNIATALAEAERVFGGLDILVANAGIAVPGSVIDLSEQEWSQVIDVNLSGVFRTMKYGLPHLLKRGGGSVIAMASTQAYRGFPGWAGYAASKGGIVALARQVAMDYSRSNIRCNVIAPGAIDTPMNEYVFAMAPDPVAERRKWDAQNPLGRIGQGADLASAAVYLASDESAWITGTCLVVDGGQLAGAN